MKSIFGSYTPSCEFEQLQRLEMLDLSSLSMFNAEKCHLEGCIETMYKFKVLKVVLMGKIKYWDPM